MHRSQGVETGGNIIEYNPGAFRKRLQLSHRRRFDDIEDTKKYKGSQKRFPCERYGHESDQLPSYFINDDKLRIFYSRASRDPSRGWNADRHDHHSQDDRNWRPQRGR